MLVQTAIDFKRIRQGLVRALEATMGKTCIVAEPDTLNNPRPPLPYFSFKITTAAAKEGDDHDEYIGNGTTTIHNRGGQRRMVVSFQCYTASTDESFELMCTWQGALELRSVQEELRKYGIAVWIVGNVADLTSLLQTGYEARSQMDVTFGIASNLTEDLGTIEEVQVQGEVEDAEGDTIAEDEFAVEEP